MSTYSLPQLLESLHESVEQDLCRVRRTFHHPGTKGDASESVWITVLNEYLPRRYQAARAHVVDSKGKVSQQIDVVIFDRQYSPIIFTYKDHSFIPAESVYAVFEAKQVATAKIISYAHGKIASVRKLHRQHLPIPGEKKARAPVEILGGVLALESDWTPALGSPLKDALMRNVQTGRIDLGCIASDGHLSFNPSSKSYAFVTAPRAATAFIFRLITRLQALGTVPMIDLEPYEKWLTEPTRKAKPKKSKQSRGKGSKSKP